MGDGDEAQLVMIQAHRRVRAGRPSAGFPPLWSLPATEEGEGGGLDNLDAARAAGRVARVCDVRH
jgi:hypothetical protein